MSSKKEIESKLNAILNERMAKLAEKFEKDISELEVMKYDFFDNIYSKFESATNAEHEEEEASKPSEENANENTEETGLSELSADKKTGNYATQPIIKKKVKPLNKSMDKTAEKLAPKPADGVRNKTPLAPRTFKRHKDKDEEKCKTIAVDKKHDQKSVDKPRSHKTLEEKTAKTIENKEDKKNKTITPGAPKKKKAGKAPPQSAVSKKTEPTSKTIEMPATTKTKKGHSPKRTKKSKETKENKEFNIEADKEEENKENKEEEEFIKQQEEENRKLEEAKKLEEEAKKKEEEKMQKINSLIKPIIPIPDEIKNTKDLPIFYFLTKTNFLKAKDKLNLIKSNPTLYKYYSGKLDFLLKERKDELEKDILPIKKEFSNYRDVNYYIDKTFTASKTAINSLVFITKEEEINLIKKENLPKEIGDLFKFIFYILNEEFDEELPGNKLVENLINVVYHKYAVKDIKNLFMSFSNGKNKFKMTRDKFEQIENLVKKSPKILSNIDMGKINRPISYMIFYLKEVYEFLSLKTDDGVYYFELKEKNEILKEKTEQLEKIEKALNEHK